MWYRPNPHSMKFELAYSVKFPQAYYAYRDNHGYRKQTTIGLLLERPSLRALTDVMHAETGVQEPLSVSSSNEGALKKLQKARYRARDLLVRIDTNTGGDEWKPPERAASGRRPRQAAGFAITREEMGEMGDLTPRLEGYSLLRPWVRMTCYAKVPNCAFFVDYRKSKVFFVLPRSHAVEAHDVARGIIQLLDRHLISHAT